MTDFADRWNFSKDRFWLRGERPAEAVEFEEKLGRWNVYGYPELIEVFDDPQTYSVDAIRLFDLDEDSMKYVEGDISQMTGPEHANARKQAGRWFTPKALGDLQRQIHQVADGLLNDLADKKRFDILDDFVEDITSIIFSELLGTPVQERDLLKLKDASMNYEGQMATAVEQGEEGYFEGLAAPLAPLRGFLGKAVDKAVKEPKDDLLSLMVKFRKLDGTAMTRDAIIAFGISILGAGRLATPMLIGNAVMCLESFPEQAARLRADRSLVPSMLEEAMRFVSPGNQTSRVTNREVELGGKRIPQDQLVMLWLGPGNRDPRGFSDPDTFDVTRSPNAHLGFGRGGYYCLGAQMVRMQARIIFNLLMDRFPKMRIDPDTAPVHFGSPEFTGPSSLTVLID